jgi:hypothetical protein
MVSLKRFLLVLLSNGERTELKSLVKSQGSWIWSFRFFGSRKKLGLSSSELGPYTLVIQKIEPLAWDSNLVEMEKVLDMEERSLRLEEFQAIKIPREAFVVSTVMKVCREFVRNVADLNWLIRDNFVSWTSKLDYMMIFHLYYIEPAKIVAHISYFCRSSSTSQAAAKSQHGLSKTGGQVSPPGTQLR